MDFDFSEDQQLLGAAVERFVADRYADPVAARRAARSGTGAIDPQNWRRLADLGLIGLAVPAESGGLGGGRVETIIAMEALGHGLVAEPIADVALVAAPLLAAAGSPMAAALIAGDRIAVLADSEAASGGARATRVRDGRVDGRKTAVLQGGTADLLIVTAIDAAGPGLWLVDAAAAERRPWRLADGSSAAEVTLHGAPGTRLGGADLLPPVLALARLGAAAEMLGLMQRLFDTTLAYVKTRQQFGQPLGTFQVIQHRMTDAYVALEQARSQVMRAALVPEAEFAPAAAGAKAYVGERAIEVAHTAVQMHGGMGITDELLVGHALKRIRVLTQWLGDGTAALDDYRRAA